jgi:outer membrane biosynthesis protein TonB
VLKFTIDENGQVRQARVVGTTGNGERDRDILRTLGGISLASSPPADLPQPIMMVILPESSGASLNCVSLR